MKIAIGTTSELKIRACEVALKKFDIDNELISIKTESGVADQPFGFGDIVIGARNRATQALNNVENAELGIGIENGLIQIEEIDQWFDLPCICISRRDGGERIAFGAGYNIPFELIERIKNENTELGKIIQEFDSSAEKDPIGYFSGGKLKREEIIAQAIECALTKIGGEKDQ
ncbi:MAG: inosine/xanthosine triphosphatase [Candidatus Berkelbacteria bacterium]